MWEVAQGIDDSPMSVYTEQMSLALGWLCVIDDWLQAISGDITIPSWSARASMFALLAAYSRQRMVVEDAFRVLSPLVASGARACRSDVPSHIGAAFRSAVHSLRLALE